MLTVDENNSQFPVGAIYQESELTYHNRVPQARSNNPALPAHSFSTRCEKAAMD